MRIHRHLVPKPGAVNAAPVKGAWIELKANLKGTDVSSGSALFVFEKARH